MIYSPNAEPRPATPPHDPRTPPGHLPEPDVPQHQPPAELPEHQVQGMNQGIQSGPVSENDKREEKDEDAEIPERRNEPPREAPPSERQDQHKKM